MSHMCCLVQLHMCRSRVCCSCCCTMYMVSLLLVQLMLSLLIVYLLAILQLLPLLMMFVLMLPQLMLPLLMLHLSMSPLPLLCGSILHDRCIRTTNENSWWKFPMIGVAQTSALVAAFESISSASASCLGCFCYTCRINWLSAALFKWPTPPYPVMISKKKRSVIWKNVNRFRNFSEKFNVIGETREIIERGKEWWH